MLKQFRLDTLVEIETDPLGRVEFLWDLLALLFQLCGFLFLVLKQLLDILAEFESEDTATLLLK